MPYFLVDGKSVYDRLRAPKFHFIRFSDGRSDCGSPANEFGEYATLVDYHVIPLYPHVAEVFGSHRPFNVLLRPDNYIGFISLDTAMHRTANYLREVFFP
jgi:hypothetical protein